MQNSDSNKISKIDNLAKFIFFGIEKSITRKDLISQFKGAFEVKEDKKEVGNFFGRSKNSRIFNLFREFQQMKKLNLAINKICIKYKLNFGFFKTGEEIEMGLRDLSDNDLVDLSYEIYRKTMENNAGKRAIGSSKRYNVLNPEFGLFFNALKHYKIKILKNMSNHSSEKYLKSANNISKYSINEVFRNKLTEDFLCALKYSNLNIFKTLGTTTIKQHQKRLGFAIKKLSKQYNINFKMEIKTNKNMVNILKLSDYTLVNLFFEIYRKAMEKTFGKRVSQNSEINDLSLTGCYFSILQSYKIKGITREMLANN